MNSTSPPGTTGRLPHLAVVTARGADAIDFLHAQLSADLRSLEPGQARWACCCEIKGRVIALLLVRRDADGATLVCAEALRTDLVGHLSRYILRSAVELAPDDLRGVIGLDDGSSGAEDALRAEAGPGYGLVPADGPDEAPPAELAAWRQAELTGGITWLGPATSGQFLPQMLGFEHIGAVAFDKGCYPGQEVVARVHFLGQVKRLPATVRTNDAPALTPMAEVTVSAGASEAGAVIVDSAGDEDGVTARLVTRLPASSQIDSITIDGRRLAVAAGGAVQGSATR